MCVFDLKQACSNNRWCLHRRFHSKFRARSDPKYHPVHRRMTHDRVPQDSVRLQVFLDMRRPEMVAELMLFLQRTSLPKMAEMAAPLHFSSKNLWRVPRGRRTVVGGNRSIPPANRCGFHEIRPKISRVFSPFLDT